MKRMNPALPRSEQPTSKAQLAERSFAELLAAASRRGFYGAASLTLNVQDGHIQHVKIATERMVR